MRLLALALGLAAAACHVDIPPAEPHAPDPESREAPPPEQPGSDGGPPFPSPEARAPAGPRAG